MNEKHAEKHASKAADPHPIAKLAAKAAAKKYSNEESSTAVPEKKSNRADGENITEYDSKYKMPGYLRQLEKAAETAKLASMSLARKTGKCSEYVANFIDIDDGKINSIEIAGMASGTNDGGASSAMDWEQEISAVNGTSGNTKNKGVSNAWTSEYDGNFRDTFQGQKSKSEIIAGLPSGIDDAGGASAAMEWEADEDVNEEDAAKPKLPVSETGWGESENHTEFKAYDISAMAKLSKIDSSSSSAAAYAMDWTETTDKEAAPKVKRPHPEDRLSQYMESYGAAKTTANAEHKRRFSAAAMEAAASAAKSSAPEDKDEWVIVDKEDAAPQEFQSKTWGISEYNWNFNNVWKNFATKKDVRKYPAEGLAAYGLSEYDSNFKVPATVIKVDLEKPQSKKMVKKPKNKIKRSTVLDIPRAFRTSEYKSTIAKFSKSKNGAKSSARKESKANVPKAAGIISMAPRYPDLIRPLKGRSEYQSQFDSGRVFKIPAYVKLRMGGKRK